MELVAQQQEGPTEMTDDQMKSMGLLAFWWRCIEAERELLDEPPLKPDALVLHYSGNGTTAMVMAEDLRNICAVYDAAREAAP